MHLDCAVLLGAVNLPPGFYGFLDSMGLHSEEVRTALYYQSLYQAVGRLSLRDPDSLSRVTIIVPDRAAVEWLATKYPGATVSSAAGMPIIVKHLGGRPPVHTSRDERLAAAAAAAARYRQNKKLAAAQARLGAADKAHPEG